MGGRQEKGGVVLDFHFPFLDLAINVQSSYYHYTSSQLRAGDALRKAQLEGYGIKVVYIDEDDALRNANYYVKDALKGISHSKFT